MKSIQVALHEIRIYLQDKGDLAFSLLLPIALFALMYGAFGGSLKFHSTAYIVNQDGGKTYSKEFIRRVEKLESLDVELVSNSDANSKLERSDVQMVVYVPKGFSSTLASGKQACLLFKQRGNGSEENQIVASLVRGVAAEMDQEFQVRNQVKANVADKHISRNHIKTVVKSYLSREQENPSVQIKEKSIGTQPDPVKQFLPGIVTMFVLFAITLNARALVDERRRGTLERLLTTRLSISELFAGKFLAGMSRGFLQTLILLTLSYLVFQLFTPLSFLQTLIVALIFSAAASAIGMVIASIAQSPDQTTWMAVFFTMATAMLGGTFFEVPKNSILATLSKASINTYVNQALKTTMVKGGSLADAGLQLGILAGVAVVALVLSRILFKVLSGGA